MTTKMLTLFSAMALAGIAQAEPGPRGGRIVWKKDLPAALKEARATSRPLMLYFTHDL